MPGVSFVGAGAAQFAAKPVSAPFPAGINSGDLLFLIAGVGTALGGTIATPAGWTQIGSQVASPFTGVSCAFFYRVYDGTEGGAVTHTWSGGGGSGEAVVLAYTGTDPAQRIDIAGTPTLGASPAGTAQTITGVTTAYALGDFVVCLAARATSRTAATLKIGATNATQDATAAFGASGVTYLAFHVQLAGAGASGDATWTESGTDQAVGVVVALKPPNPFSKLAYQFGAQQAVNRASTF